MDGTMMVNNSEGDELESEVVALLLSYFIDQAATFAHNVYAKAYSPTSWTSIYMIDLIFTLHHDGIIFLLSLFHSSFFVPNSYHETVPRNPTLPGE